VSAVACFALAFLFGDERCVGSPDFRQMPITSGSSSDPPDIRRMPTWPLCEARAWSGIGRYRYAVAPSAAGRGPASRPKDAFRGGLGRIRRQRPDVGKRQRRARMSGGFRFIEPCFLKRAVLSRGGNPPAGAGLWWRARFMKKHGWLEPYRPSRHRVRDNGRISFGRGLASGISGPQVGAISVDGAGGAGGRAMSASSRAFDVGPLGKFRS